MGTSQPSTYKASIRKPKRRCHFCNNQHCSQVGVRRNMKAGCDYYIPLDPALRPYHWSREMRLLDKRTVKISYEAINFVDDVILAINPTGTLNGTITKGIGWCIDQVREQSLTGVPDIPPRPGYKVRGDSKRVTITSTDENAEFLLRIVNHYKDKKGGISRTWAVEWCILEVKKAYEAN